MMKRVRDRQWRRGRDMGSVWMTAVLAGVLVACSDGGGGDGGGGGGNAFSGGGASGPGAQSIPAGLVGSWYAGAGHTSAPYDPVSGTWGTPSGKGLVYVFEADASYTKAYQSYESSGACSVGFTAFEYGSLAVAGSTLVTHPFSGHLVYEASCSPELNSDTPSEGLVDETFTWELLPSEYDPSLTVLRLRRNDGAESTFTPLGG